MNSLETVLHIETKLASKYSVPKTWLSRIITQFKANYLAAHLATFFFLSFIPFSIPLCHPSLTISLSLSVSVSLVCDVYTYIFSQNVKILEEMQYLNTYNENDTI